MTTLMVSAASSSSNNNISAYAVETDEEFSTAVQSFNPGDIVYSTKPVLSPHAPNSSNKLSIYTEPSGRPTGVFKNNYDPQTISDAVLDDKRKQTARDVEQNENMRVS